MVWGSLISCTRMPIRILPPFGRTACAFAAAGRPFIAYAAPAATPSSVAVRRNSLLSMLPRCSSRRRLGRYGCSLGAVIARSLHLIECLTTGFIAVRLRGQAAAASPICHHRISPAETEGTVLAACHHARSPIPPWLAPGLMHSHGRGGADIANK